MKQKITGEMCVQALKTSEQSITASEIAQLVGSDSRAVATALRKPVRDGRVKIMYKRGLGLGAHYCYLRSAAKNRGAA
jgi:hypothetical protein